MVNKYILRWNKHLFLFTSKLDKINNIAFAKKNVLLIKFILYQLRNPCLNHTNRLLKNSKETNLFSFKVPYKVRPLLTLKFPFQTSFFTIKFSMSFTPRARPNWNFCCTNPPRKSLGDAGWNYVTAGRNIYLQNFKDTVFNYVWMLPFSIKRTKFQ